MVRHTCCCKLEVVLPYALVDLRLGKNNAGIAGQEAKDIKLLGGKEHRLPLHSDKTPRRVDDQLPPFDLGDELERRLKLGRPLRPPQGGVDDGKDLLCINRLFQAGVGPQVQSPHPLGAVGKGIYGQKVRRRVTKVVGYKLHKRIGAIKV